MRVRGGEIVLSQQLYDEMQRLEATWKRLEWIARHYDEASADERADLDRVLEAIHRREDEET